MVRFDIGPLLQGQRRIAKVKNVYNSLIIGSTVLFHKNVNILYHMKTLG